MCPIPSSKDKQLLVRVYSKKDAFEAASNGADIIYFDLLDPSFGDLKKSLKCALFGVVPRIVLDQDISQIIKEIDEKKPDGILTGSLSMLRLNLNLPIHLDYNLNCFNDIDVKYFSGMNAVPIISPELSMNGLRQFKNDILPK